MLKDTKPESVPLFYHICITYINQFLLLKTEKFYKMLGVFSFRFSDVSDQQSVYGIRSKTFFTDKEMNKWHHFATVYSTKQKLRRYYINGEENTEDDKGTVPGKLGPARIGAWDGGDRNWIGYLDELVFFNVALTQEDITQVMEKGFEKALSVQSQGKLATKWGALKTVN